MQFKHVSEQVLKVCKFDHVTPVLVKLHWLRVLERIHYSSAPLSKWSITTVSVRVDPAAVRRRLALLTTFCIHG